MSEVSDFLNQIQTMYGRDYKEHEISILRDRLFSGKYTREELIRAVRDIERIDSNYLPSPKQVLGACDSAKHALAPKENKDKTLPPKDKLQFEMFRKLRDLMFSGKVTRGEILDAIRKADATRPGTGWDKCGMSLERHYKDHNFPLDKTPNNFVSTDL
jgi:hypothetical protein